MQANSAGSTTISRKRCRISFSIFMSAATWLALPFGMAAKWSDALNSGFVSRGMHHWIAFSRNNSDQHSSRSITWKCKSLCSSVSAWWGSCRTDGEVSGSLSSQKLVAAAWGIGSGRDCEFLSPIFNFQLPSLNFKLPTSNFKFPLQISTLTL